MAYDNKTMKEIPEDIQILLKTIVDHFDLEDREARERLIRQWKKLKLYFAGFQRLWYDEVAHDWRVWDEWQNIEGNDDHFYDKPINYFKALLESIIAALSVATPQIVCAPKDADNPDDILTARAGNKISKLIAKENEDTLKWIYALFVYCTEGLLTSYIYPKDNEKYGTYEEPIYKTFKEDHYICPNPLCGEIIPTEDVESPIIESSEEEIDLEIASELPPTTKICPTCQEPYDPTLLKLQEIKIERMVGTEIKNKSHQCIEVRGGLYVKVPLYAKTQEDCPYLKYSYETHFSNILKEFPELGKYFKKKGKIVNTSGGAENQYERWGRLPIGYFTDYPQYTPTCSQYWIRPSAYYTLCDDEEGIKKLQDAFPTGVKVTYVNEYFAEAVEEKLDDRWSIAFNPLADYIHYDPIGLLLVSMQDILNDLNALTLQTIEQGIPQTFVDPAVLDLDAYSQSESSPGSVYETKPVAGNKSIAEGFHTLTTATLSKEVLPYGQKTIEGGQLASGALPSLFGGSGPQGSRTASEYAMSRSQALQRLQTVWKILGFWYKNTYKIAIPNFIKDMVEDEKYVDRKEDGTFFNVIIRKSEVEGSIGDVLLDTSENLPISWNQKKDVLMELIQTGLPIVQELLVNPENLPILREAFGLEELTIPGEDDRIGELEEIRELLNSDPISMEMPSVPVDELLDNHTLRAEIDRNWLVSPEGKDAKQNNEGGYMNVLLHYKQHLFFASQAMMAEQAAMEQNSEESETGPDKKSSKNKSKGAKQKGPALIEDNNEAQLPIQ